MANTREPAVGAVGVRHVPFTEGRMIAYRNHLKKGISRAEHLNTVRGTHVTAVGIHCGAVGPERSVVRLFPALKNYRTTELPNSRTPFPPPEESAHELPTEAWQVGYVTGTPRAWRAAATVYSDPVTSIVSSG